MMVLYSLFAFVFELCCSVALGASSSMLDAAKVKAGDGGDLRTCYCATV